MTERRTPDFDELVDPDLEPDERARLLHVHELLVAAGPPPELPPALAPAAPGTTSLRLRARPSRRRLAVAAVLAAALAVAAFGAGFFVGSDDGRSPERVLDMTGPGGARASLALLPRDDAGNWPMEMTVWGLDELEGSARYELWLTRNGRRAASCGTFVVGDGRTVVLLNAPYRLKQFDGWIVTREGSSRAVLTTA